MDGKAVSRREVKFLIACADQDEDGKINKREFVLMMTCRVNTGGVYIWFPPYMGMHSIARCRVNTCF